MSCSRRSRELSSCKEEEGFNQGRGQGLIIILVLGGSMGQGIELWGLDLKGKVLMAGLGQEEIQATLVGQENLATFKLSLEVQFLVICNLKGPKQELLDQEKDLEAMDTQGKLHLVSVTQTDLVDHQTINLQ